MLTVKTSIKPSSIHGVGLFAEEFIPKGTVTWRFNPRFDIYFDPREVASMPSAERELVETYAYLSRKTGKYVYSVDNTRFANHSTNPNIDNSTVLPGDVEICGVAKRDIQAGKELTVDYRIFDAGDRDSIELWLDGK